MPSPEEITSLCEEPPEPGSTILESGSGTLDAEAHVAVPLGHAEGLHQADEVRVRSMVEHHEAGVDRDRPIATHYIGICMAAESRRTLEQRDLGMVTPSDLVVAVSHSGTTEEILRLVEFLKRQGVPLIAFTSPFSAS